MAALVPVINWTQLIKPSPKRACFTPGDSCHWLEPCPRLMLQPITGKGKERAKIVLAFDQSQLGSGILGLGILGVGVLPVESDSSNSLCLGVILGENFSGDTSIPFLAVTALTPPPTQPSQTGMRSQHFPPLSTPTPHGSPAWDPFSSAAYIH